MGWSFRACAWRSAAFFAVLVVASRASGAIGFDGIEDWQQDFLNTLELVHEADEPVVLSGLSDYAVLISDFTPERLLQTVDRSIALQPYKGSMVDASAALMGQNANALDRARLLNQLLGLGGHESRIMFVSASPGEASVEVSRGTHAPIEPLSPSLLQSIEWEVQTLSPTMWDALCQSRDGCEDWPVGEPLDVASDEIFWVQVFDSGRWLDLVPADTQLNAAARSRGKPLTAEELSRRTWNISISVINQFAGSGPDVVVLAVERPAGALHALGISYDNVSVEGGARYLPKLTIGDEAPIAGNMFSLAGQSGKLQQQLIQVRVNGMGQSHQFTRQLTAPMVAPGGLELAVRARMTVLTGPTWGQLLDEQYHRSMSRLANLLYEQGVERDDRPLNLFSFRASGFLDLSRRLSGIVGLTADRVVSYQARPAIVLELDYPLETTDELRLESMFDVLDAGHGNECRGCSRTLRLRNAVELAVVDGLLESWILGGPGDLSSHQLGRALLASGGTLSDQKPNDGRWSDLHNGQAATYRIGESSGRLVGWRLDPGPQAIPILSGGQGGAISSTATSATSAFLRNMIRYISSTCGITDISSSVILSLAGAPMTGPLLGGIVGHMCRVAEAYNKAASALNCLEFMGNDCSASDAAKELEDMLKGLGDALAIDLALGQALDILVGAGIEGIVAPALRSFFRARGARAPRAHMPPPGDSVMPPGRSVMPPPGGSVMPPGRSVMPPGESVMPPGRGAMPHREPPIPPSRTADDEFVPDEFIEVIEESGEGVPAPTGSQGRLPRTPTAGQQLSQTPGTVYRDTPDGPRPVQLVSRQDHVYADDVAYHMRQMSEQGDNYNWGSNPTDRIKVDPETGLILDGHHRVYAADRLNRQIPSDQIEWTPSTGAIGPADRVDVRPGAKPRSEANYPDRTDDPFDFQFDDLGGP